MSAAEGQLEFELPGTGGPWPYPREDLYFASGCNHAGELRGFLEAGFNVGFSAAELNEEALAELAELAWLCSAAPPLDTAGPARVREASWRPPFRFVFGDTGAFGEVSFASGRPEVVAPITEEEWRRRLRLLLSVAGVWGSSFFLVAPDMVGSQEETLARLRRWRRYLVLARKLGAHIIIPVQHGRLSLLEFWREAVATVALPALAEDLPDGGLISGITGNKDATTVEELELFAMGRVGDALEAGGVRFLLERPPPPLPPAGLWPAQRPLRATGPGHSSRLPVGRRLLGLLPPHGHVRTPGERWTQAATPPHRRSRRGGGRGRGSGNSRGEGGGTGAGASPRGAEETLTSSSAGLAPANRDSAT